MFFLGGGKCLNLGVGNVRILGVVNVLLANDSQSIFYRFPYVKYQTKQFSEDLETIFKENTSLVLKSFMCGRKTDQETR